MLNHNVCEVYLVMCLELFADRLSPAVVDIYPGTRNSRENGFVGGELPYFILLISVKCGRPVPVHQHFCYPVRASLLDYVARGNI